MGTWDEPDDWDDEPVRRRGWQLRVARVLVWGFVAMMAAAVVVPLITQMA